MNGLLQSSTRLPAALVVAALCAAPLSAEPVAITVETQKGRPIEGATVSVKDSESGAVLDSAITSDEGVGIIHQLTPGEWYFEIDRAGYMLYTAYVQVRDGKKPELGFASQVSRGDDWEPMRVKFTKATDRLRRKAVVEAPAEPRLRQPVRVEPDAPPQDQAQSQPDPPRQADPEPTPTPETRPEKMAAPEDVTRIEPTQPAAETVEVPSTVEAVEPESVPASQDAPDLTVADGEPRPLTDEPAGTPPAEDEPTTEDAEPVEEAGVEASVVEEADPPAESTSPESAAAAPPDLGPEPAPQTAPEPEAPTEDAAPAPAPAAQILPDGPIEAEPPTDEVDTRVAGEVEPTAQPPDAQVPGAPAAPAPSEAAPPVRPSSGPPAGSRYLRSATAGTCPECAPGEWAVSADVQAATAGDTRSTSTCAEDLDSRAQGFAEEIAARPQQSFAGPLTAALWRTADDADRTGLAETAAAFNSPQSFCQVVGVVFPAGAAMTGYVLEAWDDLGGRACNAEGICALPKAGWSGRPTVVSGDQATVVYSIFRNRSTRHQRSAELTVLFEPPPEWQ